MSLKRLQLSSVCVAVHFGEKNVGNAEKSKIKDPFSLVDICGGEVRGGYKTNEFKFNS